MTTTQTLFTVRERPILRCEANRALDFARNLMRQFKFVRSLARALQSMYFLGPWAPVFVAILRARCKTQSVEWQHPEAVRVAQELSQSGICMGVPLPTELAAKAASFARSTHRLKYINPHLQSDIFEQIVNEPYIRAVARAYIGAEPVLQRTSLYWTHPATDPLRRAQRELDKAKFHYDIGGFRSLAVFVYLTDVDATCGPHVMIEGTHRQYTIGKLISRFLPDVKASALFSGRIRTILGRRGTVFFEDLTCYHKHSVGDQSRLMFSISFGLRSAPGLSVPRTNVTPRIAPNLPLEVAAS